MAGEQPGQYFYRIVVLQEARTYEQLVGSLSVVISGVKGGAAVEHPGGIECRFQRRGSTLDFVISSQCRAA